MTEKLLRRRQQAYPLASPRLKSFAYGRGFFAETMARVMPDEAIFMGEIALGLSKEFTISCRKPRTTGTLQYTSRLGKQA